MVQLVHDFIEHRAKLTPLAPAISYQGVESSYAALAEMVSAAAVALIKLGIGRGERVAIYLEKCEENVIAMFGASAAGAVFVPINPLLKPDQVAYILNNCNVRILVTSRERLDQLYDVLPKCPDLRTAIVTRFASHAAPLAPMAGVNLVSWRACLSLNPSQEIAHNCHRMIDSDMAAILYTSGSTGMPKGVVLSHRNLVSGALSVASYLNNTEHDRILCLLPLSFDYGLSQLTTAFAVGACAVLMNHLLLHDVIDTVEKERITGLAAVPPLWMQLSQLNWSGALDLRYITNSGGVMPRPTLDALRQALPNVSIYLMYGLTEAFRSSFLAPDQLDAHPDSIGKAIPNAEVLVLRPDGSPCAADEPGELVHRGALVALGYWNDALQTAQRFKPLPARASGLPLPELAVWSGDTVRRDAEGYLYFVGRADDMIKTSGYRVSPSEVEEVVYASGLVGEAVAVGVPHPLLGQAIALLATRAPHLVVDEALLLASCKARLPNYMLPAFIELRHEPLPRNPNGKIDRKRLASELIDLFADRA